MQISHLRNRSCYLWCLQPPGASLFFSVVCSIHLIHLIVFKSWTGSASPCCIHSPHVPCGPLKSPGNGASSSSRGLSEVWPVYPLQTGIKPTTELLIALLKTPASLGPLLTTNNHFPSTHLCQMNWAAK